MMDKKTRNCKVTIFGDCYPLVTTEPEEHIVKAAHLVDTYMHDIATKSTTLDEKKIAVLAALRIANQVVMLEHEKDQGKHKEKQLIEAIDQELKNLMK